MPRIGVIGAGGIARAHLKALAGLEDAKIVAISDPLKERADSLAQPLGAASFADHRDVIERSEIVWICTPPSTRREQIVDAAQAGRHIMSEKPLATNYEDALAAVEAVEASGVKCIVDFCHRFRWPIQKMKEMADSGDLGDIVSMWSHRISGSTNPPRRSWRHDPRFVCGFTIESLSHDIDKIRWIAGPITGVVGQVAGTIPDLPAFDNTMGAILYLQNGGSAHLHASWASEVSWGQRGILGTKGAIVVEGKHIWEFDTVRWKVGGMEAEEVVKIQGPSLGEYGYRALARYFLDCIKEDRKPQPSIRDGLAALEISLAILRSSEERRVVPVEPRPVGA